MTRSILIPVALFGLVSSCLGSEEILGVFKSHCIQCHGENGKVKGRINLLEIETVADLTSDPERLQALIDVIDFGEMPPEDEPQLEVAKQDALLASLEGLFDDSIAGATAFAHTSIRRMNRFQYNNAVIDLFDLKSQVFTLPERMMRDHQNYFRPETGKMPDSVTVGSRPLGKSQLIEPRLAGVSAFPQDLRAEHGYDNQADHLSLSPLLMESFLKLGRSITESKDFTPKQVGLWKAFFEPPPPEADPKEIARTRLEPFLTRAFRRTVAPDVLNRYATHVAQDLDAGVTFVDAMKTVAAATLASPRFLYLYDRGADSQSAALDGFEIASRLSFLLWGSLPDEALLDLAARGELQQPDILEAQIDRMLRDRKLKRFCDSFPAQWLQLERIISSVPDPQHFPDFYFLKYRNSMHMMLEPLLLFETVLIENLPITQLLDPDFTYRSQLLEVAYADLGSPLAGANAKKAGSAVTVLNFRRVPVTDRRNGGVITNAAVMTMTSGPERTQPITRGAWLASVIFNNPPKPPPADVPALEEKPPEDEAHLTLRERLSMHRERADCAGCHEQIDPLGFALENYGPIGVWRETYENGRDIDMEGTLFRKHDFGDIPEFKDGLLTEKDRFTRGFAGHLLAFALARELGPADQPALDAIAENTARDGYRIQTLLKQVILSPPFLTQPLPPSIAHR